MGDVESGSWSRNRAGRVQQGLTFVFVHTQQQLLSLIRNQTQRSFSFSELRLKIILKTQGAEPQLLKKQMIRCFCFLCLVSSSLLYQNLAFSPCLSPLVDHLGTAAV